MKKIYIALCVDADGEEIEITNTDYNTLMEVVDSYGYDVVDVYELDYQYWLESKVFNNLTKEEYDAFLKHYKK